MMVGVSLASNAAMKAPATSSESQGRMYKTFGIALYRVAKAMG